ncbi:hypothetical protein [Zobellella aerophila]|uniref:DUF1571 domain-containing protein n=1 Tax=Zobellella aerophila TaxID=870480 RepID=A0ABP6V176_9GAMM
MLTELLLVMTLGVVDADPVAEARVRFERLSSYRLTLRSLGPRDMQVMRYGYRKPGFVRMDLISPFKGAVLIYSPLSRRVRLWPFGSPHRHPGFSLSPDNRLVRSAKGHRVDQSDVGTLLANLQALQRQGETGLLGETSIGEKSALHLIVDGMGRATVGEVARYEVWLDSGSLFPLKVVSFGRQGQEIETVLLENIELDPRLPDDFFTP